MRIRRAFLWLALATLAAISCACRGPAISKSTQIKQSERPVAKDATREELIAKYNGFASAIKTINATVELKPTAGTKYTGVIEEYHEVKAFLLAERPANVRMIGQAPVINKTVFDMVSDGQVFRVSVPSKNKFLVGNVAAEHVGNKPIENLRPQHLLDALLWPEIRKDEVVLFEEFNDATARYYVLTILRGGYHQEIYRKIWFDRADLQVARLQMFATKGLLVSDVSFSDWQPLSASAPSSETTSSAGVPAGVVDISAYPRSIHIDRPHDDYQLSLSVSKIALNEALPADRFTLDQPPGSELVRVGENPPKEKQQP